MITSGVFVRMSYLTSLGVMVNNCLVATCARAGTATQRLGAESQPARRVAQLNQEPAWIATALVVTKNGVGETTAG